MKKRGLLLCIALLASLLLSGCAFEKKDSMPAIGSSAVTIQLFAGDYLGRTKAEIESLLGGYVDEEYYNGGLIFRFSRSDMWFGFGYAMEDYTAIPDDAACTFVLASLDDAAAFDKAFLYKEDLNEKLGLSFEGPSFNEHDGIYDFYAETDAFFCSVSCNESGIAVLDEDYITYMQK